MRLPEVLILSIMMVSVGIMGCVRPDPDFNSPVGTIPKITVDYVDDTTKVYVRALDDHRYSMISIRVFDGNMTYSSTSDNNTYMEQVETQKKDFTLNITVYDKKKYYAWEGNFTVHPPTDPELVFLVTIINEKGIPKEKKVKETNLPWQTLADRVD
jgi:hypothetical protein